MNMYNFAKESCLFEIGCIQLPVRNHCFIYKFNIKVHCIQISSPELDIDDYLNGLS